MFVAIAGDMSDARVTVDDVDDCTRLHVTVDGLDDAAAGDVLRQHRLGRPGTPGRVRLDSGPCGNVPARCRKPWTGRTGST